jgi:hypothetical protein
MMSLDHAECGLEPVVERTRPTGPTSEKTDESNKTNKQYSETSRNMIFIVASLGDTLVWRCCGGEREPNCTKNDRRCREKIYFDDTFATRDQSGG